MSLLSQFYPQGSAAAGFIDLEILMVAGGGGGGGGSTALPTSYPGGGGGAGGVYYGTISVKPGSVCPVAIGAGGAGGVVPAPLAPTIYGNSGLRGGTTSFTTPVGTYRVVGGGGAAHFGDPIGPTVIDGGCGGGRSPGFNIPGKSIYSIYGSSATMDELYIGYKNGSYYGRPGATANPAHTGGGGAGMPGIYSNSGDSYNHFYSEISGTYTYYSRGGISVSPFPGAASPADANTGDGADGGNTTGGNGGSGVLIVRYPTQFAASPSFPGATDVSPSTPGFRTYRFTGNGSITLP